MTPALEHCRECDIEFTLTDLGYIPDHCVRKLYGIVDRDTKQLLRNDQVVYDEDDEPVNGVYSYRCELGGTNRCSGSGKRSREFRTRAREDKEKKQRDKAAAWKDDAAIAYDAFMEGRQGFKYDKLINLALEIYRIEYPKESIPAYGLHPWVHHTTSYGRGSYKKDVYCRFCRGLIVGKLPNIANCATPRVVHHTTACALQCLAGMRKMMPPDHKGFIDEDMPSA